MTKMKSITFGLVLLNALMSAHQVLAQPGQPVGTPIPLIDLSGFKAPSANWRIVGSAQASLNKANTLLTNKGTDVLVNLPTDAKNSADLFTNLQHGDMDLEFDYMMAAESNSGVYLQGRYEIQLRDSWQVRTPTVHDNGAIYERWDEQRPEGQKGYEGRPARQNASRAPGLWQHLKLSFQAPRFNASGTQKTQNARIIQLELNGVVIQQDIELMGPTRGSAFANERPTGPLRFQDDHGAVAIRNIRYVAYDKPRPELLNLKYTVYKGKFDKETDYGGKAPESEGVSPTLSASVSRLPNEFLIRYVGTLRVAEPGEYTFNLGAPGGTGQLTINNQPIIARGGRNNRGKAQLPKGDLPVELLYAKFLDWAQPALGLTITGPGVREFSLSGSDVLGGNDAEPILLEASTNTILRSFMDLPGVDATSFNKATSSSRGAYRVTHAASVGCADQVHYTYDLDKGALVQVWRGSFLDTTPMWHERGDGSSRPTGMVQRFGTPVLFLTQLASPQAGWATDTTNSGYRPKGYILDESDQPTFRYQSYGSSVDDQIRVLPKGEGLQRKVIVAGPARDLYARLISGTTISVLENGMYLVDGQAYVQLDDLAGAKPTIREANGGQELIVPVKGKLTYSILF